MPVSLLKFPPVIDFVSLASRQRSMCTRVYAWNETPHSFLTFTHEHTSFQLRCHWPDMDSLGECLLVVGGLYARMNGGRSKANGGAGLTQYLHYGHRTGPHSRRSPYNHPSIPMQRAHHLLRVSPTIHWVGTFPILQHTFRGRPALVSPIRPISILSVITMGRARSQASRVLIDDL